MSHDKSRLPTVGPAKPQERAAAVRLVFQHLAADDRETRVQNALEMVRSGQLDPAGLLVARGERGLLGAMICVPAPGAGGLVWPPQTKDGQDRLAMEDGLVQCATRWLRQQGSKLAQAFLTAEDKPLAGPLERNGFKHVTSLWYMRHDLALSANLLLAKEDLAYLTYADADPHVFHETLLRTYAATLDCPEVNGVRDIGEIVEGHRHQGVYNPRRWWLALANGRPVGVLLVTELPDVEGWDLSYVGVVAEARRQGMGRQLACKAILEARAAEAVQLTLSVDARNRPAWSLYQNLGFQAYDQREVYLAIW